jgi:DtxR family Mn-dependent transcriptional regulator
MATQSETLRSSAVEDYAKAIYALQARADGAPVSINAVAERLGLTPGSVSAMVKRLCELGLVEHAPYHGVALNESGRRVALEVIRHHRLLELYLVKSLGLPWDRVHEEAEVLEHVLSEQLEELIAAKLGNPTHDPHGDPIPGPDLVLSEPATLSLAALEPGDRGFFVRVSDSDPAMLRYLAERGIDHADHADHAGRGDPVGSVEPEGEVQPLGGDLALAMRVELDEASPA